MKVKKKLNYLSVKQIIYSNKLLQYPDSHKKDTLKYQILCSELKIKNDACNRKKLYTLWKKVYNHHTQIQTIAAMVSEEVSNCHNTCPAITSASLIDNKNVELTDDSKVMGCSDLHSSDVSFVRVVCSTPNNISSVNDSRTSTRRLTTVNISPEAEKVLVDLPSPHTTEMKHSLSVNVSAIPIDSKHSNVDGAFSDSCTSTSNAHLPINISPEAENIPKVLLNMSTPCTTEIKPSFSENVGSIPRDNKHSIFEGEFTMERNVWCEMFDDDNKLSKKNYPFIIRNGISKNVNNTCTLVCKYAKYLRNKRIVIFAKCKHDKCKTFKIYLSDLKVSVYSQSINFCHNQKLTGQVRGVERSIVKKKLLHQKPLMFKKQKLMTLNDKHFTATKNLNEVKSDPTVRKIRSEVLAHNDRSKNDLIDLFIYQSEHLNFVQEVSFPFCIKLFSDEQIKVLKCANKPLLHLDATGNVIRNPTTEESVQCNRILFYAGVITTESNRRLYPVFSMLSSTHDTRAILKLLNDFKYVCQKNRNWPAFSGVVTDFSLAIINAACLSFNNCVLLDYLNMCYEILHNGGSEKQLAA